MCAFADRLDLTEHRGEADKRGPAFGISVHATPAGCVACLLFTMWFCDLKQMSQGKATCSHLPPRLRDPQRLMPDPASPPAGLANYVGSEHVRVQNALREYGRWGAELLALSAWQRACGVQLPAPRCFKTCLSHAAAGALLLSRRAER